MTHGTLVDVLLEIVVRILGDASNRVVFLFPVVDLELVEYKHSFLFDGVPVGF